MPVTALFSLQKKKAPDLESDLSDSELDFDKSKVRSSFTMDSDSDAEFESEEDLKKENGEMLKMGKKYS